tara:strand:+ start:468 stop:650 length:183 start_codon:yes stop_codon:yes gene_type:complete
MKVGDLVRNIWSHATILPDGHPHLGVVVELPKESDKYPQILVAVLDSLEMWWPATTRVVK